MCDAHTVRSAVLIVLVIWCTVSDLRTGRIPNKVLAAGIVAAFFLTAAAGGAAALKGMLAGSCFPMILFPLFCLRMIGAGDIKLLCMAGAFLGWPASARCVVLSFFAGAVISLVLMYLRGNFFSRIFRLKVYVKECLQSGRMQPYLRDEDRDGRFCFSAAILAGILICLAGIRF